MTSSGLRAREGHHDVAAYPVVLETLAALRGLIAQIERRDSDLLAAFRAFHDCLRPGGVCLLSVRDCDRVERKDVVQAYGVRWRDGVRHVPLQAWHWVSQTHYDATFYVIVDAETPRIHRVTTRLHAVSISTLSALLDEAGFAACERRDETIHQPILVAAKRDT